MIEAQFLDNSKLCVLQLDGRFHAFTQGNLSISDYCRRKKGMADDLRALSETITDRHLVLNLLQGMNKRFDHMKIFIKQLQPFPSIHTIHDDLKLEEIELDHSTAQGTGLRILLRALRRQTPSIAATATVPTIAGTVVSPGGPFPSCPHPNNNGKGKGMGKEKGKGKNNGSDGSGNNSRGNPAWPSYYNP
jgi:hypothetical protein